MKKIEDALRKKYPQGGANKHSLFSYGEIIEFVEEYSNDELVRFLKWYETGIAVTNEGAQELIDKFNQQING